MIRFIRTRRHSGWRLGTPALVLAFLGLAFVPAQAQPKRDKLDQVVREGMAAAKDDAPLRVIITVAPNARQGVLAKLRAHAVEVSHDFTIINAMAAQLPAGLIRSLEKDKDVVAISYDGDVAASGISSSVTGTALAGAYSLRSTLGLEAAGSAVTKSYRRGDANGTTVADGGVKSSAPTTNYGTIGYMQVNAADSGRVLIRFEDLFGSGANQIPYGSTITSASVKFYQSGTGLTGATLRMHRMLVEWPEAATFDSMTTSGAGVQFDDVEALASADASVAGLANGVTKTLQGAGVTATVQDWANGAPNFGWALWQDKAANCNLTLSDNSVSVRRPVLTVTYMPPVDTTALTGSGVTVAVLDSGVLQDGGATDRIKTTRDFTSGSSYPLATAALDAYGHGTHVAGLIGGDKAEVKGVAPGAKFVSLRVLNNQGQGQTSHVIAAVLWAVQYRATWGIDVLNLSLGHPIYESAATDPLVQAVEVAVRNGIVVVCSAGNVGTNPATGLVGYGGITSPGNAPSAITVGAIRTQETTTRTDDVIADYSSRGPSWFDGFAKPDLVAPGHRLLSAASAAEYLFTTCPALQGPAFGGRPYLKLSGTSMAAATVSGSVALMIESAKTNFGVKPPPNAIKAMLMATAFPMSNAAGQPYHVLAQGAGALNTAGAIQMAQAVNPTVPVGGTWLVGPVDGFSTVDGQNIVWGDARNIVWGDLSLSQAFSASLTVLTTTK